MTLHKVKMLGAGILALTVLTGGAVALPRAQADVPAPTEVAAAEDPLPALWDDLAGSDDAAISRALAHMAITPKETVAFLKDHLGPVALDPTHVGQLLLALDSNEFVVRNRAEEDLEYLGKSVKPLLQKALTEDRPLEVKKRLQDLMGRLPKTSEELAAAQQQGTVVNLGGRLFLRRANGQLVQMETDPSPSGPVGPSALWVRAVRAVALLEVIATPDARQVLENLALGEEDALPTTTAKEALKRLANKQK